MATIDDQLAALRPDPRLVRAKALLAAADLLVTAGETDEAARLTARAQGLLAEVLRDGFNTATPEQQRQAQEAVGPEAGAWGARFEALGRKGRG